MATIKQLRAIKKRILLERKKKALKRAIEVEKRNLEKEIGELKNPRSLRAKKALFQFGRMAGRFLAKRAKIIKRNLDEATEERPIRGAIKRRVKKRIVKRIIKKKRGRR